MDEDDISVASTPYVQGLTAADRNDLYDDARVLRKCRQEMPEQTGLLGRRRRRNGDRALLGLRATDAANEQNEGRGASHCVTPVGPGPVALIATTLIAPSNVARQS